jgi:hypothetical protein
VLHEPVTVWTVVGFTLVVTGSFFVNRGGSESGNDDRSPGPTSVGQTLTERPNGAVTTDSSLAEASPTAS